MGLEGLEFTPRTSYVCCRLCGKVFQSRLDRQQLEEPNNVELNIAAYRLRQTWAQKHAKLHSEKAHAALRSSGLFCTPEAANKLAAFGIIDLEQLAGNEEFASAYAESSAMPSDDAEGG